MGCGSRRASSLCELTVTIGSPHDQCPPPRRRLTAPRQPPDPQSRQLDRGRGAALGAAGIQRRGQDHDRQDRLGQALPLLRHGRHPLRAARARGRLRAPPPYRPVVLGPGRQRPERREGARRGPVGLLRAHWTLARGVRRLRPRARSRPAGRPGGCSPGRPVVGNAVIGGAQARRAGSRSDAGPGDALPRRARLGAGPGRPRAAPGCAHRDHLLARLALHGPGDPPPGGDPGGLHPRAHAA